MALKIGPSAGNSWSGLLNFSSSSDGSNTEVSFGAPSSSLDAVYSGTDDLYDINREWAEQQAQKQMDFQTNANKIAMEFSAAEAEKERAFETEMANTAYQRAVQDLKAAGLNPILAYSQGGAAVPSVSSASGVTSSGAKASMSDTGYNAAKLALDAEKFKISSALDALKFILSFGK